MGRATFPPSRVCPRPSKFCCGILRLQIVDTFTAKMTGDKEDVLQLGRLRESALARRTAKRETELSVR